MRYKLLSSVAILLILTVVAFFGGAFDSSPSASVNVRGTSSSDDLFRTK